MQASIATLSLNPAVNLNNLNILILCFNSTSLMIILAQFDDTHLHFA